MGRTPSEAGSSNGPLPPTHVGGRPGDEQSEPLETDLPREIGPYRVLKRLGAGGMGIVYLAEQTEPIARQVAIKVLSPFKDDRVHQARFDREIAALATMEHAYIAQVYDAGSHGGRPFYVMEVVDGPPITQFAAEQTLSIRDRLELFLEVCEGVHHAHQRGVIHRDLKPGNVLVSNVEGERPRPRVIDFGLARQTGVASDLSVAGSVVGTPRYMSPEQLQGLEAQVDTRTDVYSLGVLLYELLVGCNPFAKGGSSSILTLARKVIEEDAPVPSREASRSGWSGSHEASESPRGVIRWSRELRGDLDWILMKALAKEPDRRYPSVSEFAADLQRHLKHEPVMAGPPTRRYRAGKFVRRHRAAVLVAGLAAILLTFAALTATIAWRRSLTSETKALASQERALEAAREAEAIRHFLEELLGSVDPSQQGRDVRLLTLLDERVGSLSKDFDDQPAVEASVRHILGRTYAALGAYPEGLYQLSLALSLRTQHAGESGVETLKTRHEMAKLALLQGNLDEAEQRVEGVLKDRRRELGAESLETEESAFLAALVAYKRGRSEEAYEAFDALQRRVARRGDTGAELALRAEQEMAGVLIRRGANEEAEALYRRILEERRSRFGDDHPATLRTENRLGNAVYRQKRFREAEEIYRGVAERSRELLGPEHPSTLLARNNVANVLDKQGNYDAAESLFRETLTTARRVVGDRHPDTLLLLNNLGNVLRHDGRFREAESFYRLARAYQVEVLGPAHLETLRTVGNLLKVFTALGSRSEADRLTLEVVRQAPDEPRAWDLRAEVLDDLGRSEEAQAARTKGTQ